MSALLPPPFLLLRINEERLINREQIAQSYLGLLR